ncbi:hypothetical protein ACNJYA_10390 [Bradyrhizobium sp. DASA03068]|uniref:hypothetical protein n=1 Tax=Bradyrhizobium sp. BLXBL-01 TaxID=3395915 RepID=UPI003F6FDE49
MGTIVDLFLFSLFIGFAGQEANRCIDNRLPGLAAYLPGYIRSGYVGVIIRDRTEGTAAKAHPQRDDQQPTTVSKAS